ncbi:MAG: hypothetical protein J6Y42_04720, partial [Bacilli bacterium]|nr:hypothetical protein [Bacilli bacterium]
LYTYNNIEPLKYLINIVMNNEVILNNYEVNELLKLIFSYALNTNLVFTNHYVNMVMNIYNHFKDILRSDTSILYFKRMVLIKLNDDKTLEAERFLNEIKDINSQDFFYRTHVILLKYESKSFKELFKKYSYKEIKEFNELETSINASKDFELSNELYDFKRKYL